MHVFISMHIHECRSTMRLHYFSSSMYDYYFGMKIHNMSLKQMGSRSVSFRVEIQEFSTLNSVYILVVPLHPALHIHAHNLCINNLNILMTYNLIKSDTLQE